MTNDVFATTWGSRAGPRPDEDLAAWHRALVRTVASHRVRTGTWQLLAAAGWPDNQSCRDLLTWSWTPGDGQAGDVRGHVVVVNLAATAAQARIPLPWPGLPGRRWSLLDLLTAEEFSRDGDELADPGLYVDLRPGQCYLLAVRRPGDADPGDADPADA